MLQAPFVAVGALAQDLTGVYAYDVEMLELRLDANRFPIGRRSLHKNKMAPNCCAY